MAASLALARFLSLEELGVVCAQEGGEALYMCRRMNCAIQRGGDGTEDATAGGSSSSRARGGNGDGFSRASANY